MKSDTKIAVLILAGGTLGASWNDVRGNVTSRALLPFGETTLLNCVYSAIRSGLSYSDTRILIAGVPHVPAGTHALPGGETFLRTLQNGIAALLPDETHLLVATADVPFLSAAAVADFLEQALKADADFVYPIVHAALCHEAYPTMRRTTLRTADGTFTGGNMVLVRTSFLQAQFDVLEAAYARRKSVWHMAWLLGADILLRLVLSRFVPKLLPVVRLEQAVSRVLKGKARAVTSAYPEIATDVDTPDEYQSALTLFTDQKAGV